MTINFKISRYSRLILTLFIAIGVISFFIFLLSPKAVQHPIHAIKIEEGEYIHGWNIRCLENPESPESTLCKTTINGDILEVQTKLRFYDFAAGPIDCEAWFSDQQLNCEAAYITSSYWPRGISVSGSTELNEAIAQEPSWRNWQGNFYGWYEFEYGQLGAILSILYTLFTFRMGFNYFSSQRSERWWHQTILIGLGLALLTFMLAPRVIPQVMADFSTNHLHRRGYSGRFDWAAWGLPILMIGILLATGLRIRLEGRANKQAMTAAFTNSLLLSTVLFLATYFVIFMQLILFDFID